ncbi:MAG: T9SS type A sorting domain-containing protein, partial [Chitinophagales bacterium]|nr:T9SS type A sorting domain-containing protein [Chitinophagales bacterium]
KVFGGTGADFIKNSTFDEFGNIYLTGLSTSLDGDLPGNYNDGTNYDYWLLKLTSSLDVIWSINFGGGGNSESSGGSILGNHIVKNNSLFFFSTSQSIAEMPTFDVECGHYNPADQPSMDAWLVAFDLPTKIDNVTLNENDIEIYPNPANDVIFVRNKSIKNLHFTIYSITGVVLKSGLIINGNAINISELNKGFYIINLSYDNISQTNLPIIITH